MPQAALGQRHLRAVQVGVGEERRRVAPFEHPSHLAQRFLAGLLQLVQRQFDADEGQRFATRIDRFLELGEKRVLRDTREVDLGLLEVRARVLQRDGDDLGAAIEVAVQVFERRALAKRLDHQLVVRLPAIRAKEALRNTDVREGRRIRRRVRRLAGRVEVEPGQSRLLLSVVDEPAAEVEMVDDLEDPLLQRLRRQRGQEAAADCEMDVLSPILLDETVRGLLHPVVLEAKLLHHELRQRVLGIAWGELCQRPNQLFLDCRLQTVERLLGRRLPNEGQRVDVETIADAGGEPERFLCFRIQSPQSAEQQVDDIVGDVC